MKVISQGYPLFLVIRNTGGLTVSFPVIGWDVDDDYLMPIIAYENRAIYGTGTICDSDDKLSFSTERTEGYSPPHKPVSNW